MCSGKSFKNKPPRIQPLLGLGRLSFSVRLCTAGSRQRPFQERHQHSDEERRRHVRWMARFLVMRVRWFAAIFLNKSPESLALCLFQIWSCLWRRQPCHWTQLLHCYGPPTRSIFIHVFPGAVAFTYVFPFPDNFHCSESFSKGTFATTCATIISGAISERSDFMGYIIFSIIVTGIIYPIQVGPLTS